MTESTEPLVIEALSLLQQLGVPLGEMTKRQSEKMAKAFLAVAGLKPGMRWSEIKVEDPSHRPRSRDCINWMNQYFGESISSGSYDDIRRKSLVFPVEIGLVLKAAGNELAATNDGTRGYAINPDFADQIKRFGTAEWDGSIDEFMQGRVKLSEKIQQKRELAMLPVQIGGEEVKFSPGEHNQIQKAVIEQFLPRFGYNAKVLYVGDTADKFLFLDEIAIKSLGFFEMSHEKLPDVLAYSAEKDWLYVIEAVHSANPISPMRKFMYESTTSSCTSGLVFITAFLNRASFKKFVGDIAWETEVWIADEPDHMIHFNGDRFMGPHA